jgi:hypothetical protein
MRKILIGTLGVTIAAIAAASYYVYGVRIPFPDYLGEDWWHDAS